MPHRAGSTGSILVLTLGSLSADFLDGTSDTELAPLVGQREGLVNQHLGFERSIFTSPDRPLTGEGR